MNEVTRIHLGRQPFTISVDAHHALKKYLADIQKQVADADVANEVELRMSELLIERGVTGEKAILLTDVDFLKEQLGDPADFSEEDEEKPAKSTANDQAPRRLFRDTDSAMISGVAAGIGSYLGLDATLVRLIFVALAIFGGGVGIILYVVLWLVVPPATTASEKLQMQGKSVTLGALKETVDKADLPGAARRANGTLLPIVNNLFRLILKILGIGFIAAGLATFFSLIATKVYMQLHHGQLFQENLFPVGVREQWLVGLVISLAAIWSIFLILVGVAFFKRKWPIRTWATVSLSGIFLIGLATSIALSADVAPQIRERYEASVHTTTIQNIKPFNKITVEGNVNIEYAPAPTHAVKEHYFGNPDLSKIKISIEGDTLRIDSTAFDGSKHCTMLCLFPEYDMTVQVYAPNLRDIDLPRGSELFDTNSSGDTETFRYTDPMVN